LSLCPGDSEMEEFRSSEDDSEPSNGVSDEEAGQESQPLLDIPVSSTAAAVSESQEFSCPSSSLRSEVFLILGFRGLSSL